MEDNWYLVLGLEFDPPEMNEEIIAKRIKECNETWSEGANNANTKAVYGKLLDSVGKIKKDMIGDQQIREQIAKAACDFLYPQIDEKLKMIGRKGNSVSIDVGKKLATSLNISVDKVEKRCLALGFKWEKAVTTDYKTIYDKYYGTKPENAHKYEPMNQELSTFKAENLYQFLFGDEVTANTKDYECESLLKKAKELKKTKEFIKQNSVGSSGRMLCGQAAIFFKNEESKAIYDNYVEFQKRVVILNDAKEISEVTGSIEEDVGEVYIQRLTECLKDRGLAEELFIAFCKIEKISYQAGNQTGSTSVYKVCRCGVTNDVSDNRKVCVSCGFDLEISCPDCGTKNDSNVKVCKCGFQFANVDKAVARCEQAKFSMEALEFETAKVHLDEAERCWRGYKEIPILRKRLQDLEHSVGAEVVKLREAISQKNFFAAKKQYKTIQSRFPDYSDSTLEDEIEYAIEEGKKLFESAKVSKNQEEILLLCSRAYEICLDLPGIKDLIPVPDPASGFKVVVNPDSRSNIISWVTTSDQSLRYVLVKSSNSFVENVSAGEIIYRGSGASFGDTDIEAGKPYYYNIFVERAGVFSNGAKGDFKENVNLFEVAHASVHPGDSSLSLSWGGMPNHATIEIYQVMEDGKEKHLMSSSAGGYLVGNLENEKQYSFHILASYVIAGKKCETKGLVLSGTPTCPPMPIDTLRIKLINDSQFMAMWVKPLDKVDEVRLYSSTVKPTFSMGDMVALSVLEESMSQVQQVPLLPTTQKELGKDEVGVGFQHNTGELLYIFAVAVKADSGMIGNVARASVAETINIKSVGAVNGKINIYLDAPKDASGFVVLYGMEKFATDLSDTETVRKYIPIKQFLEHNVLILDGVKEQRYFITVFVEFKIDGEKDYSAGTEYLFDNGKKEKITYSISVQKKLIGTNSVNLEFTGENREFVLPDIDIMSSVGNVPIFKASAQLFYQIPTQTVSGSAIFKIPLEKNLAKETHIKAFFTEEESSSRNSLSLDVKSNYKIT